MDTEQALADDAPKGPREVVPFQVFTNRDDALQIDGDFRPKPTSAIEHTFAAGAGEPGQPDAEPQPAPTPSPAPAPAEPAPAPAGADAAAEARAVVKADAAPPPWLAATTVDTGTPATNDKDETGADAPTTEE